MNKFKMQYKKLFQDIRKIFNDVDPEDFNPGQVEGMPVDEYDEEVQSILNFIVHNQEEIKLNRQILIDKLNDVWEESFGTKCSKAVVLAAALLKIIY